MPSEESKSLTALTTLYGEAAKAHQFFMHWRSRLLSGYVILLGFLCTGLAKAVSYPIWTHFLILGAIAAINEVIRHLELRNRDLYRGAQQSARAIEDEICAEGCLSDNSKIRPFGHFTANDRSIVAFSHSNTFDRIYIGIRVVVLGFAAIHVACAVHQMRCLGDESPRGVFENFELAPEREESKPHRVGSSQ